MNPQKHFKNSKSSNALFMFSLNETVMLLIMIPPLSFAFGAYFGFVYAPIIVIWMLIKKNFERNFLKNVAKRKRFYSWNRVRR